MRKLLTTIAFAVGFAGAAFAEGVPIKFTLDWKIQGVHGWFYLAKEKGYFAAEGLDVTIDQGEGSAATVSRIMSGAYDAGFGDMNAIIQNAATNPDEAPVMVYQIYNQPPFAVLTKTGGPVESLASLEGLKVGAPPGSASTKLFPALPRPRALMPARSNWSASSPTCKSRCWCRIRSRPAWCSTSQLPQHPWHRDGPRHGFHMVSLWCFGAGYLLERCDGLAQAFG